MQHIMSWEEIQDQWDSEGYHPAIFDQDHYNVMQYTGIDDKFGTEIYEGYIVHCFGGEYFQGYWEHDCFIFVDSINNPFTMLELTESENLEAIGNIYNDKNLLKMCKNYVEEKE